MAELVELTCPNCGAKLEKVGGAAQAQCPHCGTQLLIERKAMAVTPPEPGRCPKCGKGDALRKVSAVHRAGLSSGSYSGHVWTDDGLDSVSLSGHTQTALSRLFNPPKEPRSRTWGGIALVAFGLWCLAALSPLFCYGLFSLFVRFELAGVALVAFAVLTGLLYVFLPLWFGLRKVNSKRLRFPVEKARWETAMQRWEWLYYCARDDGVFIPGETSFIPTTKMREFLYAAR